MMEIVNWSIMVQAVPGKSETYLREKLKEKSKVLKAWLKW
jgi:hypothetical protein